MLKPSGGIFKKMFNPSKMAQTKAAPQSAVQRTSGSMGKGPVKKGLLNRARRASY